LGFRKTGFSIAGGIDIDPYCKFAFEKYTGGTFLHTDIAKIDPRRIEAMFGAARPRILVGCAPCRTFSEYNKKERGKKWNLLPAFAKLVEATEPDMITMENVARLVTYRSGRIFSKFVDRLASLGYNVTWFVVRATDYGISQRRKRVVIFGSRRGFIELLPPTHSEAPTLRSVIGHMPPLRAGTKSASDRYHTAPSLSTKNATRLRHSRPGGTWRDWPENLRARCHKTRAGAEFGSVYGRLDWDSVGPTVTTQYIKVGTGRFTHPSQNRALSLREGALLQTFPPRFQFVDPSEPVLTTRVARLIGNAVPVHLAEVIAVSMREHINHHYAGLRGAD
jgi:DNA (cytosine-5)-methyltransferase 1